MIGKKIGPYEIKRKLGQGGMASVWLATHTYLRQDRAIKLLSDQLVGSGEAKRRFLKEATEAVKLQHEGIATVFDAGEEKGNLFIAFEYIDGQTVSEMVRETGFHIGPAARVAREVAEALEHAHSKKIVHRDVTARNVMVNRDGKAILVDFGLVLNVEASRFSITTNSLMGTVAYMSPEVVQGKRADHRSDIYGLGVVLYEMLTRRLPFTGERAEAVLHKVVHEEAESIEKHLPGIAMGLVRIVEKAMNKDPEKRFASAQEMADELREYETIEDPVTARYDPEVPRPPESSIWSQITTWPVRHPKMGAVSIVLVALLALYSWNPDEFRVRTWIHKIIRPPDPQLAYVSVAIMPVQGGIGTRDDDYIALAMGKSLAKKLQGVSGLRVTPWETSRRQNVADDLPSVIAGELGVKALVLASFKRSGQRLQFTVSLVDGESEMLSAADPFEDLESDFLSLQNQAALAVASHIKPGLTQEERDLITKQPTVNPAAYENYIKGAAIWDSSDKPQEFDRALRLFEQAASLDTSFVDALVGIGNVHLGRYFSGGVGEQGLQLAKDSFQRALDLDPGHLRALRGLTSVHWHRGEWEACLGIGEEIRRVGSDRDVEALMARALAFIFGGFPSLAVPLLERVQKIDPMNQISPRYQVPALTWAGEPEKAIKVANAFLRDFEERPEIHMWAAASYHMLRDLEKAELHYESAIDLFGVNSDQYIYNLASRLYDELGESEKTRDLCIRGKEHMEYLYKFDPDNLRLQSSLLGIYMVLEDREGMARILESLDLDSTPNGSLLWNPAIGYARLGEHERAVSLLRRMVELGAWSEFMVNLQGVTGLEVLQALPSYKEFLREFEARETDLLSRYGDGGTRDS